MCVFVLNNLFVGMLENTRLHVFSRRRYVKFVRPSRSQNGKWKKTSSTRYEWHFKKTQLKRYSVCSFKFCPFSVGDPGQVTRNVVATPPPHTHSTTTVVMLHSESEQS